jgi:alkyl hydroperoxide reductase subunit AhpC
MKDPSLSDTRILAVAIDSKEDLQKMSDNISKNGGQPVGFLFMSDPQHTVINRYGLLNERSQGLPHPATFVIDKKGVVRWKSVDVNYRVRPTNQQILEALKALR